jgi:hypothetical protein
MNEAHLLGRLSAQLELGFFSVPGLCDEFSVGHRDMLQLLTSLLDRGAIEQLPASPYLRLTPEGDRLRVWATEIDPP